MSPNSEKDSSNLFRYIKETWPHITLAYFRPAELPLEKRHILDKILSDFTISLKSNKPLVLSADFSTLQYHKTLTLVNESKPMMYLQESKVLPTCEMIFNEF